MRDRIRSQEDMVRLIETFGFLPFFENGIDGFSIEERTPAGLWYNGSVDGRDDWPVWDWKGPAIQRSGGMYGKFFRKKAGYVSREWIPDFINLRRGGTDLDERYEAGEIYYKDKAVISAVRLYGSLLTPHLKMQSGFGKGGSGGFETVVTRLQMQTDLCIADFVYRVDKRGKEYGWGVARYTTPEAQFGDAFVRSAFTRSPEASRERILAHLSALLPHATEQQIIKMIG